ncbi:MAG: RNA polymerase sigma factor [Acidimicrobiales bacterium]
MTVPAGAAADARLGDDRSSVDMARLWSDHAPAIWAYAARRIGRQHADDVVSQVFLVAWTHRSEAVARPLPWLYGVARNVVNERRRSEGRVERLNRQVGRERKAVPETRDGPSGQRLDALGALGRLSPSDQDLLMGLAWDGLSMNDLAASLGISGPALRVRVHRARVRLEKALGTVDISPRGRRRR